MSEGNSLLGAVRAAAGTDTAVSAADHTAAVAAARKEGEEAGHAAGKAEGVKEGVTSAHTRLSAILGDDKVKGRESAAIDLAIASPDMSAESVVSFVSKHGASAPTTAGSRLDALMDDTKVTATAGKADVGADDFWAGSVARTNAAAKSGRA